MEKKESYIVIDGVRYDAVRFEYGTTRTCKDCAFYCLGECTLPNIDGLFVNCDGDHTFVSRGEVAAQPRLTERSEEEVDQDKPVAFKIIGPSPEEKEVDKEPDEKEDAKASSANVSVTDKDDKDFVFTGAIKTATLKAYKPKRAGAIGKRSYYSFPNGVEAEDICRYLSFNLGNVVRYACRAGRMDCYKKIEDLEKARDYLDNEIERAEEELGNEIKGLKEKIAKENEGR